MLLVTEALMKTNWYQNWFQGKTTLRREFWKCLSDLIRFLVDKQAEVQSMLLEESGAAVTEGNLEPGRETRDRDCTYVL